jgi:hypothetical protein
MSDTKVELIKSKKELDEFLTNNDVLSVQAIIISGLRPSFMRDGGTVMENSLWWSVWYKYKNCDIKQGGIKK